MRALLPLSFALLAACAGDKAGPADTGGGTDGVVDADGDGVPAEEDCDDADPAAAPGVEEVCDGVDNDCDGEVDEGVQGTWYADADGDGYGDPAAATEACAAPAEAVADGTDCDDTDERVWPGANEVCDGVDNNCDGAVDEGVQGTWYADADGDGYGAADLPQTACEQPSGTVEDATDCDDTTPLVHPGAAEVCDELDNDCDEDVDEGVQTTFWADLDGDGWGEASATLEACSLPIGYADQPGDCDDADPLAAPDLPEECDGWDNDCDGDIDEDDALDAGTFYTDSDGDGYGDPASSLTSCTWPSGMELNALDCDDADAAISPAATEVCDSVDNDCDGDIDDADSSLDTSTATTWYADADGDGEGDPDVSTLACVQPSGTVSNDTDCDDADASDLDGDGTQDCADDDRDGDGLRNDWDADADDDSVVRPPRHGLGGDGSHTVSGTETASDWTLLASGASAGDSALTVDDASAFSAGDEVLVWSQQGADAGTWQSVMVDAVSGTTLTIEPGLEDDYSSSSVVLVQRVPHYTDLTVPSGATLTADAWAGGGGGLVIARATGSVTIAGTVAADALGFEGGAAIAGNGSSPRQGESHPGLGARGDTAANGGGGGAYPSRGDNGDSGGGGGYGSAGGAGLNYYNSSVTDGGATHGDADLSTLYLGSGGGAGSPDTEGDGSSSSNRTGAGGAGGGAVLLFAGTSLSITGTVSADGADGGAATSVGGEVGGGGAGSGGAIWLASDSVSISGSVTASGGSGGASAWHSGSPYGYAYGGDGGDGRVRLDSNSLTGSTTPTAGHTAAWVE